MLYLTLFWSFCQIGLFSIGGGYAALPIIQKQVVDIHHWLSLQEFMDIIAISQMTPGPVAINTATFVGMRLLGFAGAVVATLGFVVPSCVIVLSIAYFYFKYRNLWTIQGILGGLRPATIALIAVSGLGILSMSLFGVEIEDINIQSFQGLDLLALFSFVLSTFLLRKYKLNPVFIILGSGLVSLGVMILL